MARKKEVEVMLTAFRILRSRFRVMSQPAKVNGGLKGLSLTDKWMKGG